jgi:hypothetical protein
MTGSSDTTRGNSTARSSPNGARPGTAFRRLATRLTLDGAEAVGRGTGAATPAVEARILRLGGRPLTEATFTQLEERPIFHFERGRLSLLGEPWGPVVHLFDVSRPWEDAYTVWRSGQRLYRMPTPRADCLESPCAILETPWKLWACPACARSPDYVLCCRDRCCACGRRCRVIDMPRWVRQGQLFFYWIGAQELWLEREDDVYSQELYAAVVSHLRRFEEMAQILIEV